MQLADIQLNSTNTEGFWATAAPGTAQTVTTNVPDLAENQPGPLPRRRAWERKDGSKPLTSKKER